MMSDTTPTIVATVCCSPNRTCRPIGSSFGQNSRANVCEIMATGEFPSESAVLKSRPFTSPICIVEKYSGEAAQNSAPVLSPGWAGLLTASTRTPWPKPPNGTLLAAPAEATPATHEGAPELLHPKFSSASHLCISSWVAQVAQL